MVHSRKAVDILLEAVNLFQSIGVENVSMLDTEHDGDGFSAPVDPAELLVNLDVRIVFWKEILEARGYSDSTRPIAHQDCQKHERQTDWGPKFQQGTNGHSHQSRPMCAEKSATDSSAATLQNNAVKKIPLNNQAHARLNSFCAVPPQIFPASCAGRFNSSTNSKPFNASQPG